MTSPSLPVPVIVVGSGITALGVVRILGRRSIPAFVASAAPAVERHSRWYRPVPGPFDPERLAESLDRVPIERAVLIGCSDMAARAVAEVPSGLRGRFPASVPSPGVLGSLVDKAGLAALLTEHGVPHPLTAVVKGSSELPPWAEHVGLAFVKPCDSQRFFARFGQKAFMPERPGELSSLVERAVGEGFDVVIQEYVPGPASNHYFIDGFMDRRGAVAAIFTRRRLRMYPPRFGNSSAVVSVQRAEARPAEEHLVRLLTGVGYRGIFSAEFKQDARDGIFRLLEINARPWWYVEFAARSGVDVVSMAYADALEWPVGSVDRYSVGRRLVFPYYDLAASLEAGASAGRAARTIGSWIGADHVVFARDDPMPLVRELRGLSRGFVTRRVERWRARGGTP